jgi:hypothetical protein
MNVSDVESVLHLLQSISGWGIGFIILVILPIYTLGWSAVFKLLNFNTKQSYGFVLIILISIIVSLLMLKIGIDKDQKLAAHAIQIKQHVLYFNNDWIQIDDLVKNKFIPNGDEYIDDLIDRFPESFTYGRDISTRNLKIIDTVTLNQLEKNINKLVPLVYSQLSHLLKKDSLLELEYYYENIDHRITYKIFEKVISKYPDEFIEITKYENPETKFYIKRIK